MQSGRRRGACATCHARKVKCDVALSGTPCSNCRKAARDDCKVHQKKRRVGSRPHFPVAIAADGYATDLPNTNGIYRHTDPYPPPAIFATQQATSALTSLPTAATPAFHGLTGEEYSSHLVQFAEQPAINERPIDRDARVTYIGTDVSNLNFLTLQKSADRAANVCHHPTNRIARQLTVYEPDQLPAEALQLPEKPLVDRLLRSYFDLVNPGFPVVDEVLFMAQYHARDPGNPPSLLLLQALLVAGAHVCFEDKLEREHNKALFFRRAKMLIDARFERNRDVVVQSALLLAWHSDGAEDVAANSWFWIHHAATIALGLGMHRNAEPSTLVDYNKRMWRRVFWLLYAYDAAASLQSGRPQAIQLEDCDVEELRESDFEDCGGGTDVAFVMQYVRLFRVIAQAVRERFRPKLQPEQRKQALADADARLAQWSLSLPESLQMRPTLTLGLYASMLHLIYNTALILLHRPRPTCSGQYDTRPEDVDICSAAASHVQSLMEGMRVRAMLPQLPNSSIHICFTTMIQLNVEARLANPVLATAANRRYESLLSSLRSLADLWPLAEPIAYFFDHAARERQRERSAASAPKLPDESPTVQMLDPALGIQTNIIEGGAATNDGHNVADLQHGEQWQQLFPDGLDLQNQHAGMQCWDEWQALYWQGGSMDSFSPHLVYAP